MTDPSAELSRNIPDKLGIARAAPYAVQGLRLHASALVVG
jgi:hypothetical protein